MTADTGDREPPREEANSFVETAADAGYDLDFTPESLVTLDALVEDLTEEGTEAFGLLIAAYLGEVFVRNYDGEWTYNGQMGWLVDLSAATDRDGANLFGLPDAARAVVAGEETFARIHDRTVGGLTVDGPTLSGDATAPQDGPDGEPIGEDAPAPQDGPDGEPIGEDARRTYRERADALVEEWPGHGLDYSAASLAAVDQLIADSYDRTPADVDRAERQSTTLGRIPDDAEVSIDTGTETSRLAAYVGEVFCREYDAEWYGGEFDSIVFETADGAFQFDPEYAVNAAYHGWTSFQRLHGALSEQDLGE